MSLQVQKHPRITTYNPKGLPNGYLIPIFNINDHFWGSSFEPQQVNLTVMSPGCIKGPHIHDFRSNNFTCIKGVIRVVVKINNEYFEYLSGEIYEYLSIEVPSGIPAVIQNIGKEDAFVLTMPNPAWKPDMNDEHFADFSDFDFNL